jgi:hypothetical protein
LSLIRSSIIVRPLPRPRPIPPPDAAAILPAGEYPRSSEPSVRRLRLNTQISAPFAGRTDDTSSIFVELGR